MKLSLPIYRLKRRARLVSRHQGIPLHQALDQIAIGEGFSRWSQLAAEIPSSNPAARLLADFEPGEMVLLAARPGHGKTQLGLELVIAAIKSGRHGVFFSLEYTPTDMVGLFRSIGEEPASFRNKLQFDDSDDMCAEHIKTKLSLAAAKTLVVIDYLQLLDQKRCNPNLADQITSLGSFARSRGLVFVFLSQVDRRYQGRRNTFPGLGDVRLPNPLDLRLFNKACFLNDGVVKVLAPD